MPPPLSDEIRSKIATLLQAVPTPSAPTVAKEVGVSATSVRGIATALGIELPTGRRSGYRHPVAAGRQAEAIARAEHGEQPRQIATAMRVSLRSVQGWLRSATGSENK